MIRFITCVLFCAFSFPVHAQQPTRIPQIGFLIASKSSVNAARIGAFQDGLRELGYVEGKSIIVYYRYAEGQLDRLPKLATELVERNVEIIVTAGPADTRAARKATDTIPIVMSFDNDPVGNGFVASLARPGGNITGLSTLAPELSGKQLELLKEIIPKLSRAAVFGNSTNPGNALSLRELNPAAEALKVKLDKDNIIVPKDIEPAFRIALKERDEGVLVLGSLGINSQRKQIADLAIKSDCRRFITLWKWWKPAGSSPTA